MINFVAFLRRSLTAIALLTMVLSLTPVVASAATANISLWPTGYWGKNPALISCTGDGKSGETCTSLCDFLETLKRFVYFGMTLALFVFAPISILVGGIMMMIAGASPGQYQQGKKYITGTVIAVLIVLGAFLIVDTFFKVVVQGLGGTTMNWSTLQCDPADMPGTITP